MRKLLILSILLSCAWLRASEFTDDHWYLNEVITLERCIDMVLEDNINNDDTYEIDESEAKSFCLNERIAFMDSLAKDQRFPVGKERK